MKRLHMSLNVSDLNESIRFYTDLFGEKPTMVREDYAQWLLDDPRVNMTLEQSTTTPGLSHAGIQVESGEELSEVQARMTTAEMPYLEEGETTCCYHRSEKSWTRDPDGLPWEAFLTHGESEHRGESNVDIPMERDVQAKNSGASSDSTARCC